MSTKTGFSEPGLKYWTVAARENDSGYRTYGGNVTKGVVAVNIEEALELFKHTFPGYTAVNLSHIGPVDAFNTQHILLIQEKSKS